MFLVSHDAISVSVRPQVARGGNMVPQMVDTKLMTRETYTLYGIEGDFGNKDGKLTFTEKVRTMHQTLAFYFGAELDAEQTARCSMAVDRKGPQDGLDIQPSWIARLDQSEFRSVQLTCPLTCAEKSSFPYAWLHKSLFSIICRVDILKLRFR